MSAPGHSVTIPKSQSHVIDPTNPRRALDDGIKHRLHVSRRAADDAKHLGGCRLMLQGIAQLYVSVLQFFEQPHVLDGDHCLISEGLEKRDLLFSEGTNFRASDKNDADCNPLSQQWCSQGRASASHWLDVSTPRKFALHFYTYIMNMDRLSVSDSPARNPTTIYNRFL